MNHLSWWTNQNQGKSYNLNLTIPISYVEENMKRAEVRDAVSSQKFYFRYPWAPQSETFSVRTVELSCQKYLFKHTVCYILWAQHWTP